VAAALEGEPDFSIAGQAGSLAEASGMLRETDVGIFDLGLPDGYGGDLFRACAPLTRAPRHSS
jgi:DNA-binding NarL/FixJ family response regulator